MSINRITVKNGELEMLLLEAIELLEQGENVVRECWTKDDGYLAFMQGMTHVWKIMLHPNPNAGNYIFSKDDLKATDWRVFKFGEMVEVVADVVVEDNCNAA